MQGLRDLGYVEDKNIAFEYRTTEGKSEQRPDQVAELVHLKVDVIVTDTTGAALSRQEGHHHNPYCDDVQYAILWGPD